MNVPVWIPVLVALIASIPGVLLWRSGREQTQAQKSGKELELILSGLTALVNELQEERDHFRAALELCQEEIRRVRIMR